MKKTLSYLVKKVLDHIKFYHCVNETKEWKKEGISKLKQIYPK